MAVHSRVGDLTARLGSLADADLDVQRAATTYRATFTCLVATCALMPAYVVRWRVGPLPTTLLEAAILVTIGALLVESWQARQAPPWRSPLVVPAGLFLVAAAVAVLVSPDHRAALGLYRAYVLEPIALFVVAGAVVRTEARARALVVALWLGGGVVGLANLAVVLNALRHHTLNVAIAPPVVIYMTPNAVALYLVPLVALAGALLLHAEDRRLRLAAAAFAAVGVAATLASFSRGGYMALAVIGLLLVLSHRWRYALVPGLVVVGVVAARVPPVASRLAHEVNLADPNNSFVERVHLWGATLRMLRDHPVFGAGLSGFAKTIDAYRNGQYTEHLIYPHDIVLNAWSETGLVGLVAFAWIMVQGFRLALRGWRRADAAWRPYHLGVALALVGLVVHGLVDVPYWKNDLSAEFWVLMALTWAGTRWTRARA